MRIEDLDGLLKKQGIPIDGISGERDNAVIHFKPEATDQQRIDAKNVLKNFDWVEKTQQDLDTYVANMTKAEKDEILDRLIAAYIRVHSNWMEGDE